MLFQPSNIYPSTFSGIGAGTVDVTQGLNVSWQVNGDTPMTAYRIKIYQNDSSSTLMYDSGSLAVTPAFEPHDKYGNPTFFSTQISAAALSTAGIVNGYQYGYKMLITQYWDVSNYVEQTSASVFITRSTPSLAIDAISSPVTTSSITITATYSQAQGDPISTVEWVFAQAGSESTPIKETGAVSTQILSFDVDGLITGNTYSVMCNVVTANGVEATTGWVQFSVSYPSSSIAIDYQLAQLKNSSATYLSWEGLGSNILAYPYTDTTKTTNGITFTVNGEGDIVATGTASADAYFTIAQGTLSQLGITAGQKFIVTSGYSGAKIVVTETNSSNVVVSTITGNDPLQYIATSTTNTLKFSIVIPSGSVLSSGQQLKPMIALEDKIVAFNDVSANIEPIQDLHGYSSPWPAGGGKNKCSYDTAYEAPTGNTVTVNLFNMNLTAGVTYTFSCKQSAALASSTRNTLCIKPSGGSATYENSGTNYNPTDLRHVLTYTAPSTGEYTFQYWGHTLSEAVTLTEWQVEESASFTGFAPYSNICSISGRTGLSVYVSPTQDVADATTYAVDWTSEAGTVYGGTLDVASGVLTVNKAYALLNDKTKWEPFSDGSTINFKYNQNFSDRKKYDNSYTGIMSSYIGIIRNGINTGRWASASSYIFGIKSNYLTLQQIQDDAEAGKIAICYELATPLTYQLTAQEVALLVGTNNIWSTGDSVSVTYTKNTGTPATLSGEIVTITDSNAVAIPTPVYTPGITGVSIYRYSQGSPVLSKVYEISDDTSHILDYDAPSQEQLSYLIAAHSGVGDLFCQTNTFKPVFWFYSLLLCNQDSSGNYHVVKEYIFKYGVETGAMSNNNDPTLQKNFTPYPNRQPISSLYKTGKLTSYIGKTNGQNQYSDSVSLQNAIYDISTSPLTKFLKTRKGDILMIDTAAAIQMKTEDATTQQALRATVDWVEVGDASNKSIVSVPTDSFWPIQ